MAFGGETGAPEEVSVLTLFFDREAGGNSDNPFISSYLDANRSRDLEGDAKLPFDYSLLAKQLEGADSFYAYNGSMTQPECGDGFTFVVPDKILSIS